MLSVEPGVAARDRLGASGRAGPSVEPGVDGRVGADSCAGSGSRRRRRDSVGGAGGVAERAAPDGTWAWPASTAASRRSRGRSGPVASARRLGSPAEPGPADPAEPADPCRDGRYDSNETPPDTPTAESPTRRSAGSAGEEEWERSRSSRRDGVRSDRKRSLVPGAEWSGTRGFSGTWGTFARSGG
ncbi:hypothetical protein GCM10009573_30250 [Agromyces bracchium]